MDGLLKCVFCFLRFLSFCSLGGTTLKYEVLECMDWFCSMSSRRKGLEVFGLGLGFEGSC